MEEDKSIALEKKKSKFFKKVISEEHVLNKIQRNQIQSFYDTQKRHMKLNTGIS